MFEEKRFYNREKIAASNYDFFYTRHSLNATQIIKPFLNPRISANRDKVDGLSTNGKIPIKFFKM